jgi:hypothetical protein
LVLPSKEFPLKTLCSSEWQVHAWRQSKTLCHLGHLCLCAFRCFALRIFNSCKNEVFDNFLVVAIA